MRPLTADRLPVLAYHSVDEGKSPLSVSPAQFRRQMQYLQASGWHTLTTDQLLAGHSSGRWPQRSFMLTFDDGFCNVAESAVPVLTACGFSAIVFVVVDWVGKTNDWPGQPGWVERQALLDWSELRALRGAGIEVGAHTLTHPHLTRLGGEDIEREIVKSKGEIESHAGCAVQTMAYPYGDISNVIETTAGRHYQAAFGTRLAVVTPRSRSTALERIDMYYLRRHRLFAALESGWLDVYLTLRRWPRDLMRSVERT